MSYHLDPCVANPKRKMFLFNLIFFLNFLLLLFCFVRRSCREAGETGLRVFSSFSFQSTALLFLLSLSNFYLSSLSRKFHANAKFHRFVKIKFFIFLFSFSIIRNHSKHLSPSPTVTFTHSQFFSAIFFFATLFKSLIPIDFQFPALVVFWYLNFGNFFIVLFFGFGFGNWIICFEEVNWVGLEVRLRSNWVIAGSGFRFLDRLLICLVVDRIYRFGSDQGRNSAIRWRCSEGSFTGSRRIGF